MKVFTEKNRMSLPRLAWRVRTDPVCWRSTGRWCAGVSPSPASSWRTPAAGSCTPAASWGPACTPWGPACTPEGPACTPGDPCTPGCTCPGSPGPPALGRPSWSPAFWRSKHVLFRGGMMESGIQDRCDICGQFWSNLQTNHIYFKKFYRGIYSTPTLIFLPLPWFFCWFFSLFFFGGFYTAQANF